MACLTSQELALYREDRLDDAARGPAEVHLSRCRSCRRLLVEAHDTGRPLSPAAPVPEELVQSARAIGRRQLGVDRGGAYRWWIAVAAMLAAVVGFIVFDLDHSDRRPAPADSEILRADGAGAPQLQGLAPDDGAVLEEETVELRWTAATGASRYTVTLVDPLGDIVFRTTTPPTDRLRVDLSAIPLAPPTSYFWYVTADLADGTSLESPMRRLTVGVSDGLLPLPDPPPP